MSSPHVKRLSLEVGGREGEGGGEGRDLLSMLLALYSGISDVVQ